MKLRNLLQQHLLRGSRGLHGAAVHRSDHTGSNIDQFRLRFRKGTSIQYFRMEERGGGRQTGLAVRHAPSVPCCHTASIVTVGKLGAAGGSVGLQRVAIHSDETGCPIDPCHRHGSGRKTPSFDPDVWAVTILF